MRMISTKELLDLCIRILICFAMLFLIIIAVHSYSSSDTDSIQLLIECKEQQDVLQEQIDALNIRIKETDRTITEHWKDMLRILNQVKEAPTANE